MKSESWVHGLGHAVLDLVYPVACVGCERAEISDASDWFCVECEPELDRIRDPICNFCGDSLSGETKNPDHCLTCRGRELEFDFARSSFLSRGRVRDMITRFKFQRQMHLVPALVDLLALTLEDECVQSVDSWLLVPIPLHRKRLRERHFNQSEEFCTVLSGKTGMPTRDVLFRTRETEHQAHLSREDRLKNLQGLFEVKAAELDQNRLEGANILLVDDVFTTGATVHECAKVLKASGNASRVGAITVARGGMKAS